MSSEKSPFLQLDEETKSEVRASLHNAQFGSLATINPNDGYPMSSRILVATDYDGSPVTLISTLAAHTKALLADGRCSLMVGEPGKGDPLASPRLMLTCDSRQIQPDDEKLIDLRDRFSRFHPKSKIYSGFADFSFFKLDVFYATYNGGFGRAYHISKEDIQDSGNLFINNAKLENEIIHEITEIYSDRFQEFFKKLHNDVKINWKIRGIDDFGLDIELNNKPFRMSYFSKVIIKEDINKQITAKIVNMF